MTIPFSTIVKNLPATTPFVGPETLERQQGKVFNARIGANESAFGQSPLAVAAMREAVAESHWYADPENYELRQALAQIHNVEIDEICVDAGIDSLLGLTVRMLIEPGQSVVTSHGAYPDTELSCGRLWCKSRYGAIQELSRRPGRTYRCSKRTSGEIGISRKPRQSDGHMAYSRYAHSNDQQAPGQLRIRPG